MTGMSHPPRLKSADAATSAWRPRRHGPDLAVGPPLCWCWGGHFLTLYHHTQRLWWMIALIGAVLSASMIYGQHVLLVWWWKKIHCAYCKLFIYCHCLLYLQYIARISLDFEDAYKWISLVEFYDTYIYYVGSCLSLVKYNAGELLPMI